MKSSNVVAFLAGAVAGGLLALLTTPKTGAENRKIIADKLKEGVDLSKRELEDLKDWIREKLDNQDFIDEEEEIFVEVVDKEEPKKKS